MPAAVSRKKSPRAPSISLDEALGRALQAYDKERLHPAPADVVAQNLGYKSANNGAALSALASLRYYGLVERPSDGLLAITKDVESYKFSPDDEHKQLLVISFLKKPPLFSEMLIQYESGLPSDANIRYELIQRGFAPSTAGNVVEIFRRSVEFAGFFNLSPPVGESTAHASDAEPIAATELPASQFVEPGMSRQSVGAAGNAPLISPVSVDFVDTSEDRIPVRLHGGRRAWLVIPDPFFDADKVRLKAQIDLLLTQDDEQNF